MELKITDSRLLIAELRNSENNNQKSSFKDDHDRDRLSPETRRNLKIYRQQIGAQSSVTLQLETGKPARIDT